MKRLLGLLALLPLVACTPRQPPAAGVTELLYASPYSPTHPFSRADQDWIRFVEERSGGSLRIRTSWSGALLSSEHSMLELRHGVADVGLVTPIYTKGGTHLIRLQSGFYTGADTVEKQVALYYCMARHHPQFASEMAGLKVLAVQGGSQPGILMRAGPLGSLDDLRGKRIRVPTELLPVLRALGADPVNMPMGEVYSALAKGVIDGVVAPPDTFRALHFAEVARHYTALAVPRGAYPGRAMSEARWKQLSAAQRRVLEESIPVWEAALARQTREAVQRGLETAQRDGVQLQPASAADQARFNQVYTQEAERSARSLSRYGIDGLSVYRTARASVTVAGEIDCKEPN
ncbi:MAG: hypothetical protein RL026_845 [Pseudomonadota bacterium]|jgi:TRAP-type C4-dicarboxylate transport system substrate-binding protein